MAAGIHWPMDRVTLEDVFLVWRANSNFIVIGELERGSPGIGLCVKHQIKEVAYSLSGERTGGHEQGLWAINTVPGYSNEACGVLGLPVNLSMFRCH